jgi:hypothetical protein
MMTAAAAWVSSMHPAHLLRNHEGTCQHQLAAAHRSQMKHIPQTWPVLLAATACTLLASAPLAAALPLACALQWDVLAA